MMRPTPEASWPDEDLVRECRAGNQAAWDALIEKYKKLVYTMPARYGLPPQEAADIFQMVWADLYNDLDRLQNPKALRGWLTTATARRCLLHKRRLPKDAELLDTDLTAQDDTAALQMEAERHQTVREAVAELPARCHRMINMLFFDQPPRSYLEVAKELGLAEGSIGFIRGRCLNKLRELLRAKGCE